MVSANGVSALSRGGGVVDSAEPRSISFISFVSTEYPSSPLGPAMPQTHHTLDPEILSKEERQALLDQVDDLASLVGKHDEQTVLRIKDREVVLPPSVARALVDVLTDMAEGRPVSVASSDEELTTREAAELLNVSRPHLVKLLEEGEIPFHKVGTHRRVYREDVLEYKARQREEAEEAMQNLTDQAQELGLGY